MIYFVESQETGLIKIGRTTHRMKTRLMTLRSQLHMPIVLLDTINGLDSAEQYLHRKFRPYRAHFQNSREWFEPTSELMNFIGGFQNINVRDEWDNFFEFPSLESMCQHEFDYMIENTVGNFKHMREVVLNHVAWNGYSEYRIEEFAKRIDSENLLRICLNNRVDRFARAK